MKTKASKLVLVLAVVTMAWANYCFADVVVTNSAPSPDDQKQGYIENSTVSFTVTNGQSSDMAKTANGRPLTKAMRKVELNINAKKIIIQNSRDEELYVKGQDQSGSIATLDVKDYNTIQQALANLGQMRPGNTANELHEAVDTALRLLAAWPHKMPLLIWQDARQKLYAIDNNSVFSEPRPTKPVAKLSQAKSINKSLLQHPDALQLPEIQPLQPLPLLEIAPNTTASPKSSSDTMKALGSSSSNSSKSLCTKMGANVQGNYPLISTTFSFPFTKTDGTEKYKAKVGGGQCLARCGGGCVDSVSGAYGFGKNAYSQDCLDHDMCVAKRGNGGYCNFIFSDAANDFFATPCKHDLVLENIVVSNDSTASSQMSGLSSQQNLFVIFTVKNSAKTRLPHIKVYFDISVDGQKKSTRQLVKVLNGRDSSRYFYPIGSANSYLTGKHSVSILINSTNLIETKITNNVVKKDFNLL